MPNAVLVVLPAQLLDQIVIQMDAMIRMDMLLILMVMVIAHHAHLQAA